MNTEGCHGFLGAPGGLLLGSLFSGYGGLDLAIEKVMGTTTAWFSESWRPAATVFGHHWPEAAPLGDITQVDFRHVPRVDVLAGGFPCQDVSSTGRRAGLAPGTRTGLWAHMARAIEALRPRLVIAENVMGLLYAPGRHERETGGPGCGAVGRGGGCVAGGTGLPLRAAGVVFADLARIGMHARWRVVRASDAGAPHRRARVFIVAWDPQAVPDPAGFGRLPWPGQPGAPQDEARHLDGRACDRVRASTAGWDWHGYEPAVARWEHVTGHACPHPFGGTQANRAVADPRFIEWMMGLAPGWVTSPDIGITRRQQRRILGNGVVPQQGVLALTQLLG